MTAPIHDVARKHGCTDRQARFVAAYLAYDNGTHAAICAGYAEGSAEVSASRLLRMDKVKAAIAEARKPLMDELALSAERVLEELSAVAFGGLSRVLKIDQNGVPEVDLTRISLRDLQCSADISVEYVSQGPGEPPIVRTRIKSRDKLKALDKLAQHLGLYKEDARDEKKEALQRLVDDLMSRLPGIDRIIFK